MKKEFTAEEVNKIAQQNFEAGRKSITIHEHNWLIKDEHSGWLSRFGGRELKTVYCSKCLREKYI